MSLYNNWDIYKTIGGRYAVWRRADNVVDSVHETRAEAEKAMHKLDADEFGYAITDITDNPAIEVSTAARTAQDKEKTSKGLSKDSPGVDSRGDTKKVT